MIWLKTEDQELVHLGRIGVNTVMTGKHDMKVIRGAKKRGLAFLLVLTVALAMTMTFPGMAFADDEAGVRVEIPFSLSLDNEAASQSKVYSFSLTAEDGAPLPENEVTEIQMNEAGDGSFGPLVFTEEGEYHYTVQQTTEAEAGFILDSSVYNITIAVGPTDEEDLALLYMLVNKEGQEEKPESISFANSYKTTEGNPPNEPVDDNPDEPEKQEPKQPTTDTQKPQSPDQKEVKQTRTGYYVKLALPFVALAGAAGIMIFLFATRRRREDQ